MLELMQDPILFLSHVEYAYGKKPALIDVCFSMMPLDFVAIIGPNGGGKSTLVQLIMGLIQPDKGHVLLFNEPPEKGRRHVGYLSQASTMDAQYPIKVLDVVLTSRLLGNLWHRVTQKDREEACECLDLVGVLPLQNRALSDLSGGERQRVFIARALLNGPRLLILDEPTSSVDPQAERAFYELLKILNEKMAILMVSHDISAVSQLVKKVACLNQKLIYHDSKELCAHDLEATYGCPVELIAHGVPHRVLHAHE